MENSFREEFQNEISSFAVTNMYSNREAFFEYSCNFIAEVGEIKEANPCFYEGKSKTGKKIQLDGYYFDDFTRELNLIICDYNTKFTSRDLGLTETRILVSQAMAFVENRDYLETYIEESTPAYQFIDWMKYMWDEILKIRVIVLSTEETKSTIKRIEKTEFEGREVYYNVWGLQRFEELFNSTSMSSHITIDLLDYMQNGIPALSASDANVSEYKSFLAVMDGSVLAKLYDDYGAKLLEGNVRSFLSYRGKVNKAIRATIIGRPHMFFAFNNGIAATASGVETHIVNGELFIKSISDFQIVNGGQTTASIFNVKYVKKEANLQGVYVPMKLNVVEDEKKAELLIPIIAETANTQNKVNKADFFANSGFHRRIEQISNVLTTPALDGNQYGTKWFYERARGAYDTKLISFKTSNAKKDQFLLTHPKKQKITKTDLAKYFNSVNRKPYSVSKGAQSNFVEFANNMDMIWRRNQDFVNEDFYKSIVVGGIIFKSLEKLVSSSSWYQNAFRANIVTYSISYFFEKIATQTSDSFDYDIIWKYQQVPTQLVEVFNNITYEVFKEITRELPHRTKNVTEWCKKKDCWNEMVQNIKFDFIDDVQSYLITQEEVKKRANSAKKEQRAVNKLNYQIDVVNRGGAFWKKVLDYGTEKRKLFSVELDLIKLASNMEKTGRVPSEKQAKIIINILEKIKLEGFVE